MGTFKKNFSRVHNGVEIGQNMGEFYIKTQVGFIVSGDIIPHKSFVDIDV